LNTKKRNIILPDGLNNNNKILQDFRVIKNFAKLNILLYISNPDMDDSDSEDEDSDRYKYPYLTSFIDRKIKINKFIKKYSKSEFYMNSKSEFYIEPEPPMTQKISICNYKIFIKCPDLYAYC
jgi:hypothetical protein